MDRLTVAVTPRSPFRLPRMVGGDGVMRTASGVLERLIVVEGAAVIVRVSQDRGDRVLFEAEGLGSKEPAGPGADGLVDPDEDHLEAAIARLRFATGVDDDLSEVAARFRDDCLIGREVRSRLHRRAVRRPFAWEALAWGVTEQLIEYKRATSIQRRISSRWGIGARGLRTVPEAGVIAGLAPAELESAGLSARRSIAMIRVAREVSRGRIDLDDPADDRRLLAIPEIGPWTIACLGLHGRGDPDALLAGDLSHLKLVGYLAGLGRQARVDEVEDFYWPYAPWRGWAGNLMLSRHGSLVRGAGNTTRLRRSAAWARAA